MSHGLDFSYSFTWSKQLVIGSEQDYDSLEKLVAGLGFGQLSKRVIKGEFKATERAKTVGFSHSDFGLVVQALDDAAGEQLLSPEIVEDQLAGSRSERAICFMGSMRERIT